MRSMLISAALAMAALAGALVLAEDGRRADADIASPTGGVARAMMAPGTVDRLDYALDAPATLTLVHAVGDAVLGETVITNAAAAGARGSVASPGLVGGDDYIRLESATNVHARIYILSH